MKTLFRWRPEVSIFTFILIITAGNLALYQKPLLGYGLSVSALPAKAGWLQILSLEVVQYCLLASVLFFVATFSITALRLLASLLALINAAALYFMLTYNMELDRTMIANILSTDSREAAGLWHISIVPYLMLLGVVPAVMIWRTKLRRSTWLRRLFGSIIAFVALFTWLYMTSATWLWYDKYASRMGSKILPWSYVINTARHFNRIALDERQQTLLPDAVFEDGSPDRKEVVVLVIGEAARAESFSLYGYAKNTNAFTKGTSIIALPMGRSCATNTISSTACLLTHEGSDASSHTEFEPLPSYLTRFGVETIYRTNNSGPPPVDVTTFQRASEISAGCTSGTCPTPGMDEVLNWGLADVLNASSSKRIFVTLHQTGSHGPAYYTKYPKGFDQFKPECKTVQVSSCSQEELSNAYDNTIRYNDFLLADLITQLETVDANTAMIYVSDHGQSLGESGFYLHGAPNAVAPKQQREIPFLVWMSEGFKAQRGITDADIIPSETFPHDFPFHSVMGAFGMTSDIYKPKFDIFRSQR
ncbi:lipid A ethanolaminephosphotransferase [Sulfitobacter undariae]|uniref:Lipid A ethanolaminephosphotransferase n=1 Tax=Sulfitobacter undariae TaxID=1563671 RepID=A0A7W6H212_9RHOB|nr:sulfatase-like hydrolase/transferase [Sulfitobacter undariae]MBB3996110.1 lipid A ethanolaminephosphotransferase [Sulfitobacter undariae]